MFCAVALDVCCNVYVPFCDVLVYNLYVKLSPSSSVALAFTVNEFVVFEFNAFTANTGATLSFIVVIVPVFVTSSCPSLTTTVYECVVNGVKPVIFHVLVWFGPYVCPFIINLYVNVSPSVSVACATI